MNILLLNLPWKHGEKVGVRAGSRWPHLKEEPERDYLPFPFFLAYGASLLKSHDFNVKLIDAIAANMSFKNLLSLCQKKQYHILVTETSAPSRSQDLAMIKELAPHFDKVILCGPDWNYFYSREFLSNHPYIYAVIKGEYEFQLLQLLKLYKQEKQFFTFGNVLSRYKEPMVNPPKLFNHIDALPWPERDSLPMQKYIDAPGGIPLPSAQMWASRGCPFQCTFCSWPQVMYDMGKYRPRSVADVVDEMEHLTGNLGFKSIYFDDDTFNVGKQRMLDLAHEILCRRRQGKLRIPWAAMCRADLMNEEVLLALKSAGLYAVKYGIESADSQILQRCQKNMDLEKAIHSVKLTQKLGIKTHLTFTFGLPGETWETIEKTIRLALALSPTSLQFSIATPFPGTAFEKESSEFEEDSSALSKEELLQAQQSAYGRWKDHLCRSRTPKAISLKNIPFKRLPSYLKKYGFESAIVKLFDYSLFFLRHNLEIRKHRSDYIQMNHLRLARVDRQIRLYYKDTEITHSAGLHATFLFENKRFDTSFSDTQFSKVNPHECFIKFDFSNQGLDLQFIWWFRMTPHQELTFHIQSTSQKTFQIKQLKISLLLPKLYDRYETPIIGGYFPKVKDWETISLGKVQKEYIRLHSRKTSHPNISFSFNQNDSPFEEVVENTDRLHEGRMIHALHPKHLSLPQGKGLIFQGALYFYL